MNWKTCSVEVEARISKRPNPTPSYNAARYLVSGMQKNELTMFRPTCYSSLVPRVHPGLLYAATFLRMCAQRVAVEL
jgi:poly-beta-hydroxyalkanoate depolymerase